jgi:putative glutamine amidotransferase
MTPRRPVIGLSADRHMIASHPSHVVGEKYIRAVIDGAGAIPLLIPALGPELDVDELLRHLDGILFTGSPSNVEPQRYAGTASAAGTLHDPYRDATTLPLIPRAIATGVAVLGICRGFQEMNVAFGGTLVQKLHEVAGNLDHRDDERAPLEVQYAEVHDVMLAPGGLLQRLAGAERARVNSLHSQGVERLGDRLVVEARAPDGVIEAFRVQDSPRFAVAVQWHPEWQATSNSLSRALFAAFGAASRERAQEQVHHGE